MNPEDRVLVGVINRKRDLNYARDQHWYRIPQKRMPLGVYTDYLAFFLSGKVFKEQSGGIHYYAPVKGLELAYRRDLLPDEAKHARADEVYYRVALGDLEVKSPPVVNTNKRVIHFIRTTWDRFVHARHIADLYSNADYFVDRIYHALRSSGIQAQHVWESERSTFSFAPGLRVLCEDGPMDVSTQPGEGAVYVDPSQKRDAILTQILAAIDEHGGPVTVNIPPE
jgi:hypothetical protein